jgi:L-histidine N-alpha-methyltransferase
MRELWRSSVLPLLSGVAGASRRTADDEDFFHRGNVMRSIAGGHVPLKFAYAGHAAFTHDLYARTVDYSAMMASAPREVEILVTAPCQTAFGGDMVEIGPGNGLHTIALLEHMSACGLTPGRYLGVDFSATLLDISSTTLRQHFGPAFPVSTAMWDVESRPAGVIDHWRSGDDPILICLVGHTLGNFEDPLQALRNIAGEARPGDILLASVLLRPASPMGDTPLDAYHTAAFRRAALAPMLTVGMNASEMDFSIEYRDGAFLGEVILPDGASLDDVNLPRGHRFRCFMSRRFESGDVIRLAERAGWSIYTAEVERDSDRMIVVASRAEESR